MLKFSNPSTIFPPQADYTHAIEVPAGARLLVIAGQVGVNAKGEIAESFADQAENVFANLGAVLKANGMSFADAVKTTMFLTSRDFVPELGPIRKRHMGDHKPTSTLVIVAGLAHPKFKIEVEMIAARG
jgi:enamine deaminase RidA (YjgF/YER057c/UK114 family)